MPVNNRTWVFNTPAFLDDYLRLNCHHFCNDVPVICSMLFSSVPPNARNKKNYHSAFEQKRKQNQIKPNELLAAEAITLAFNVSMRNIENHNFYDIE